MRRRAIYFLAGLALAGGFVWWWLSGIFKN